MQEEGCMISLITGGSGSGKSAFAEKRILEYANEKRIYIATMHPYDAEAFAKVARHQRMRKKKGFETIECYTDLKNISLMRADDILLECLSNLTANELFEENGAKEKAAEQIMEGIRKLSYLSENLVIVSNEIFSDGIEYDRETEHYIEVLAQVNREVAALADEVIEVVYGIPVYHKRR